MELLCIDDEGITSLLTRNKIYNFDCITGTSPKYLRVSVKESPGNSFYTHRFTINPPPDATEETIRELEVLWEKLCNML